jgi:hypothetical protein
MTCGQGQQVGRQRLDERSTKCLTQRLAQPHIERGAVCSGGRLFHRPHREFLKLMSHEGGADRSGSSSICHCKIEIAGAERDTGIEADPNMPRRLTNR